MKKTFSAININKTETSITKNNKIIIVDKRKIRGSRKL